MQGTVTPLDTATKALRAASNEALLDAIVRLTHAIHGAEHADTKDRLRRQRALVRAEAMTRMGRNGGIR